MLVSFLITFREGLEAFLMVGILLAYLRQLGALEYRKWIFAGVAAGILAAIASAVVLEFVVSKFESRTYQLVLTAAIMITAVCVLTYMAIWMQKQAREATGAAKAQLKEHVTAGNVFGIAFLAAISVWREGIETVLFFSAVAYEGGELSLPGALLGLAVAVVVVWALMKGVKNVPIREFFRWSSLLLIIIAAGLLSSATNILQGLSVLPGPLEPLFDISGILSDQGGVGGFLRGLFGYTATPTPLQFTVWVVFLGVAVFLWQRSYAQSAAPKRA